MKFPTRPEVERSLPLRSGEQLDPTPPRPRDPTGMPCGQRSAARHRRLLGPRSPGGAGGRAGTPACPHRQQRGRAALPSRCLRFAAALFPLQLRICPPFAPSPPSDITVGARRATDGCLRRCRRRSAGCKVKRQSPSCWGLGGGGRPPLPPPHAPWSPAAGSPITWEFSHVTGGGCAVVPGAVGCLWWGRGYIHPCWQLSARAGTPSA